MTSQAVKYTKVVIKKSTKPEKKLMATFSSDKPKVADGKSKKTKTIHFGQAGAPDYTKTKDKEQRSRYISRHRRRENWTVPDNAGSLAKHLLWGESTSLNTNIKSFKKKFNLK
jgi:hypothetical protein